MTKSVLKIGCAKISVGKDRGRGIENTWTIAKNMVGVLKIGIFQYRQ